MFVIMDPAMTVVLGHVEGDVIDLRAIPFGSVVCEPLYLVDAMKPQNPIPPELDRAIDAWNAMAPRLKFHIETIKKRERFVAPYRQWKKKLGERAYLLEQLIPDVAVTEFCHPWIRFGWLLRFKGGEANSDVIHSGQWKTGLSGPKLLTADQIAGRPAQEPGPETELTRIEKIQMQRVPIYRLLDQIGDPETDPRARRYFNVLATRITPDVSGDRWGHWKDLCAEASFEPQPNRRTEP